MFWRSTLAMAVSCALLVHPSLGADKPFRVTLVGDAYLAGGWMTGVRIELDEGWKTYWRMPGEAGIPPEFKWSASVPAGIEVLYPLPGRFADASGETVGYKDEVVFPVIVKAAAATGLKLEVDLFFAVCRDICIPAQAKAAIELGPSLRDAAGSQRVEHWTSRVPAAGLIAVAASVVSESGKPVLHLDLAEPVDDIFIETNTSAYLRAPEFSADGRKARLVIDNVKDPAALSGTALKLTFSKSTGGLEQSLTLP
jgi:DsbC/DsbD-like thiol-disulfide interchange protein